MRSPRRRGRPPLDADSARSRLLEAASRLFDRDGYFGTDTNKIAREAGMAPATLYRHFANKLELFLAVYALWVDREWEVIAANSQGSGTAAAVARRVVAAMLEHHGRWRGVRASMHALIATDPTARRFGERLRRDQIERTRRFLRTDRARALGDAERAFAFLAIERANNALTDGDLAAFGVEETPFVRRLEQEVAYLMTGRRPPLRI